MTEREPTPLFPDSDASIRRGEETPSPGTAVGPAGHIVPVDELDHQFKPVTEKWSITDTGGLNWALSKIGELEAQQRQNERDAEIMHAMIDRKLSHMNARSESAASFFRMHVTRYCEDHRLELLGHGRQKSRQLIAGKVGWRATGEKVTVVDEAKALEWARRQPVEAGLIRLKESINKTALHDHVVGTGEVPPGCEYEHPKEKFYVKPDPPAFLAGAHVPSLTGGEHDDE